MSDLKTFFERSPIAKRTALPADVVLHRTTLTVGALADIRERGTFEPGGTDLRHGELEVGGQVIARGRIVRRKGRSFFRVTEVLFDRPSDRGGEI